MDIKTIFEKAENGTLTLEQFLAAAKEAKAKFVDLSEGEYVSKQKYTDDIATRDTRIGTLEGNLKDIRGKLDAAGADAEALATLKKDFEELKTKYDTDTKTYQEQLRQQSYKYAVNDLASQYKFTSSAAKRDFINSLIAKDLKMDGDKILGATDFIDEYSQENEDAFVKEDSGTDNKPHFSDSTNPPAGSTGGDVNPFSFNFMGVRPRK